MFEVLTAIFLVLTLVFTYLGYPVVRHFLDYQNERSSLEKRYNRLWRSRKDLLVSYLIALQRRMLRLMVDVFRVTWTGRSRDRIPSGRSSS